MGSSFCLLSHENVSFFDQNVDMSMRVCHVFEYNMLFMFYGRVLHTVSPPPPQFEHRKLCHCHLKHWG